jgi:hypothetical protein
MRIYLTHCSKEKSIFAKASGKPIPPDELYTEEGIRDFMQSCKLNGVDWAILSDHYGVFFPFEKYAYYEKPPASVTPEEEAAIIVQFNERLKDYDEIWFYVRPATFHPFYERVLKGSDLAARVHLFQILEKIKSSENFKN